MSRMAAFAVGPNTAFDGKAAFLMRVTFEMTKVDRRPSARTTLTSSPGLIPVSRCH